jgi:hypothetical protein
VPQASKALAPAAATASSWLPLPPLTLIAPTTAPARFKGDSAGENHDAAVIRCVDAEELLSWLAVLGRFRRREIEGARRERLVHRDIDTVDPRIVHSNVDHQIHKILRTTPWSISLLAGLRKARNRFSELRLCLAQCKPRRD